MPKISDLADVGVDPEDQRKYQKVVAPAQPAPAPPPADHPLVRLAQSIVAPMNVQSPDAADRNRPAAAPTQHSSVSALPSSFQTQPNAPLTREKLVNDIGNIPVVGGILNFGADQIQAGALGGPQHQLQDALSRKPAGANQSPDAAARNFRRLSLREGLANPDADTAAAAQATLNVVGGAVGNLENKGGQFAAKILKDSTPAVVDAAGNIIQKLESFKAAAAEATRLNAANVPQDAAKVFQVTQEAQLTAALQQVPEDVSTAVRRTARAMPELTAQDMVDAGPLRSHLQLSLAKAKMPATDENVLALAEQLLTTEKARPTIGNKNAADIAEALSGIKPPSSVPASAEQAAAQAGQTTAAQAAHAAGLADEAAARQPGFLRSAEDMVANRPTSFDEMVGDAGAIPPSRSGPKLIATGGRNEPSLPLPVPTGRSAGQTALALVDELWNAWRPILTGGDLSTVLIQGAPALALDIAKLPYYAIHAATGGTQRPFFHSALGRMFQAVVSSPTKANELRQGFINTLEKEGFTRGMQPFIPDAGSGFGQISAREELMVTNLTTKIPVLGFFFRQTNQGASMLLSAIRTGEAVNLKRAAEGVGLKPDLRKIVSAVDIGTGRGDLPLANSDAAQVISKSLSEVFLGPRLFSASWQLPVQAVKSLIYNIPKSVISRKPIDPIDIHRIAKLTTYVGAGVGVMKLMEASGMPIGTDPTKTDFGRVTLPDGKRLDLWGRFNEEARLIARGMAWAQEVSGGKKPAYGATTFGDQLLQYGRSGLNAGGARAAGDFAFGETQAGVPFTEAYTSTDYKKNPLIPVPFSAQNAISAGETAAQGNVALGGAEALIGVFGGTIIDTPAKTVFDGLGRNDRNADFGKDAIFEEYSKLFGQDKLLTPPDSTLGSGDNSFKLPDTERNTYIAMVGDQRRITLGNLIYSQEYQNANKDQQQKMFKAAQSEADSIANREYLKTAVTTSTDPKQIAAEAVTGFHAQPNEKEKAYWISTLNEAGKLTPEVKKAIESSTVTLPGEKAATTVEEYLRAAPLVHEYLQHVPYGNDAHPIGTPEDWAAVEDARKHNTTLRDQYIRSGVVPSLAEARAQQETLKALSVVQRSLFVNGPSLVNPQRKVLETKYGQTLTRFLGPSSGSIQEKP